MHLNYNLINKAFRFELNGDIRMILESKYDVDETVRRMKENTCSLQHFIKTNYRDKAKLPPYCGSYDDTRIFVHSFQLQRLHTNRRGEGLTISGDIYEEEGKTIVEFWPLPKVSHIVASLIFLALIVHSIIQGSWIGVAGFAVISALIVVIELIDIRTNLKQFRIFIEEEL